MISLNIPQHLHTFLKAKVKHFIDNHAWNIPACLLLAYPDLHSLTANITIPLRDNVDRRCWKHSHDGDLTMKDSYCFHCITGQQFNWSKIVWNIDIPPSKSMVAWRSLQNKLPTDECLALRGCHMPSMCSLCESDLESNQHLFLTCRYSQNIWNWLSSCLNFNCQFNDLKEAFVLCNSSWSPLCNLIVAAAIVNCVDFIWFARNQSRFNDKKIHWRSLINHIIAAVSLSGNNSCLKAKSNISEFALLRKFKVKMNYGNAPKIKEVLWQPPILNWIKCNCDGASMGNPGSSACGGLFRDANSSFLGVFSYNIGISTSLNAELIGAMVAIETATSKGWSNFG
ncbi:hypothetical protein TSUD_11730 [Trifolium subterraneum]|uniref:Reverse transcriptase zinc-binding domain-containing protein n=1 Tax=Trifolium subterraneum TaxID=3900 RepID=A0A2Z6P654_TRISU|nr:hypothetical protein TSUD_11730 [Trifolium subterraneum]